MSGPVTSLRTDITRPLADALHTAPRVAWDIETSGLDWRTDSIGTCQLHAPEIGGVLVQLDGPPPERLREVLADPRVLKVFHHAPFDLRFLTSQWKTRVSSVACTKVASKLLNPNAPTGAHSLQHTLARHLGVHITKDERASDWLATELTPAQLAYAIADVAHLLPLLDVLEGQLHSAGLSGLFRECLAFLPTRVELDLRGYTDIFAYEQHPAARLEAPTPTR